MAEIGTALAVIAFADQCLKYGNKFVKRCKSYLHAEEEATELLVAIESNWVKMETQIEILKKVAPGLNKRLQNMQSQVLSQLEGKLKTASLVIEQLMIQKREDEKGIGLGKKDKENWVHDDRDIVTMMKGLTDMKATKKAKYVSKKDSLFKVLEEIEKWQARYDPTWILIMQMSIGNIDEQLDKEEQKPQLNQIPIIMAAKGIRDAVRSSQDMKVRDQGTIWIHKDDLELDPSNIPNSTVEISDLEYEKGMVLIDTMVCNSAADMNFTMREVRNMARILAEVDPLTFGLLKCRGVIKIFRSSASLAPLTGFKFIFDVPKPLSNPQSLRAVLLSETAYPLDERLDLAKKLTSSILFVHTVNFVHKNIRPETIIVFQNEHSEIGAPFLAGFQQFRLEDGHTIRSGDDLWQHNLYRHPSRQGTHPEVNYQMQHDIYSLGVVLLEIGLWTSFVLFGPETEKNGENDPPTYTEDDSVPFPSDESSGPFPNDLLEPKQALNPLGNAVENKERLEYLAENELPARLGRRYTDIVLLCLRCLDPGTGENKTGKGFGADVKDEDGFVIGVRFIENVLEKMQEITM